MSSKKVEPPLRLTKETRARVREVLNGLPALPEFQGIASLIDSQTDWIIKFAEIELSRSGVTMLGSDQQSQKTVNQVLKLARRLDQALLSMPIGAWAILRFELGSVDVATLGSDVLARSRLGPLRAKRGRPVSRSTASAGFLAEKAAVAYTLITGKPATPGERSKFPQFLKHIYSALGMRDSAEVQAKARRIREKKQAK